MRRGLTERKCVSEMRNRAAVGSDTNRMVIRRISSYPCNIGRSNPKLLIQYYCFNVQCMLGTMVANNRSATYNASRIVLCTAKGKTIHLIRNIRHFLS